jgi:fimbrial chaperone protein
MNARRIFWGLLSGVLLAHAGAARASEIGVTPVAVHLDKANDRATVTVVNSGAEAVIMQVEMIGWKRSGGVDEDVATTDMVVNPSVFTLPPGRSQLVRVGLRRAAADQSEGTYRILLREVPPAPQPGEVRIAGQVRVLMALRVPVYVAPHNVVHAAQWQAERQPDGSVVAALSNEGNVHVRVGKIQLRAVDGAPVASDATAAAVVFPGEKQRFRIAGLAPGDLRPMTLEVQTDQGLASVPVEFARR